MRKRLNYWSCVIICMAVLQSATGCGWMPSRPEVVETPCAAEPEVPDAVAARASVSASKEIDLLTEWEPLWDNFVQNLQRALDNYNRALTESFSGARVSGSSPVSAPAGQ